MKKNKTNLKEAVAWINKFHPFWGLSFKDGVVYEKETWWPHDSKERSASHVFSIYNGYRHGGWSRSNKYAQQLSNSKNRAATREALAHGFYDDFPGPNYQFKTETIWD